MTDTDEVVSWIDPDGVETVLTNQPFLDCEWGVSGRYMPPVTFVEDDVAQQDGAALRRVRALPRNVALPLQILAADIATLRPQLRQLVATFNPLRGDGRLRVRSFDGLTRDITCRYQSGLEVVEEFSNVVGWQRCMVTLRARDPFWYDLEPTVQTYTLETPEPFFPILPIRLNSDTVFGTQTVTNDGDIEAFPVWTIHGPATSVMLTNSNTGEVIDLPIVLTEDQTVVIDTRPFRRTVRRDDGTNLYGELSSSSSLWWLPKGATTVQVVLPGASADSYVTLTYLRRWLTV